MSNQDNHNGGFRMARHVTLNDAGHPANGYTYGGWFATSKRSNCYFDPDRKGLFSLEDGSEMPGGAIFFGEPFDTLEDLQIAYVNGGKVPHEKPLALSAL